MFHGSLLRPLLDVMFLLVLENSLEVFAAFPLAGVSQRPFKYYVRMFFGFFGTHVRTNSTVNQQKLPFSDPTHPT